MIIDSKKVFSNLKKKGFIEAPGDHKFLQYYHKGILLLSTKISHGPTHDIRDSLINKMANQCMIDKKDFSDIVNCSLSAEGYLGKLTDKGITR